MYALAGNVLCPFTPYPPSALDFWLRKGMQIFGTHTDTGTLTHTHTDTHPGEWTLHTISRQRVERAKWKRLCLVLDYVNDANSQFPRRHCESFGHTAGKAMRISEEKVRAGRLLKDTPHAVKEEKGKQKGRATVSNAKNSHYNFTLNICKFSINLLISKRSFRCSDSLYYFINIHIFLHIWIYLTFN